MPAKKKVSKKKIGVRRAVGKVKKKAVSAKGGETVLDRCLSELTERIDIVLPEVTGRVAALEHLLLELNLCTRADLRRAREFVHQQEA